MYWTLHVRNVNHREPAAGCVHYPSRTEALRAAATLILHANLGKTPVHIVGPEGQHIDKEAIEDWARDHLAPRPPSDAKLFRLRPAD